MIDATTGGHLWSQRYDRPLKDIFALQDEIVQKIVTTLKLQLTLQEQGCIVRKHTDNLEAYDFSCAGWSIFGAITKEANAQARQMFEKAVALDPQYAEAYARLGWTYWREWGLRWSADPQTLERALALAQQALALDDSLPLAHSLLGEVYVLNSSMTKPLPKANEPSPSTPTMRTAMSWQTNVLNFAGRPAEALRRVEQAMRLNPRYPPDYLFQIGLDLLLDRAVYRGGRHAAGIRQPEPQFSACPRLSWLSATYGSGTFNRIRMPRRWRRRWRRRNGAVPLMTPTPRVTWSWAMSTCRKSSMSRPWPRWSGPSPSIPTWLMAMRVWLKC